MHEHDHDHVHDEMEHPGAFRGRAAPLRRDYVARAFTVGIGGPVGSGKTALLLALCRALRDRYSLGVVTNDIFTREDAEFLMRHEALPTARIRAVETGGCPHAAIREDISHNLLALEELMDRPRGLRRGLQICRALRALKMPPRGEPAQRAAFGSPGVSPGKLHSDASPVGTAPNSHTHIPGLLKPPDPESLLLPTPSRNARTAWAFPKSPRPSSPRARSPCTCRRCTRVALQPVAHFNRLKRASSRSRRPFRRRGSARTPGWRWNRGTTPRRAAGRYAGSADSRPRCPRPFGCVRPGWSWPDKPRAPRPRRTSPGHRPSS